MHDAFRSSFDESALLQAMQQGDERAFEHLFRHYYPHLVLFARRYVSDKGMAESIVQDVFVGLWEKRSEQVIQSLRGFLVVTVRHRCQNELKHLQVIQKHEKHEMNQPVAEWPVYEESHYLDRINSVIRELPEQRRKIFKMSRLEGLKYKEIAEKLNISQKTVEAQMGKALKFLREKLKPLKEQLTMFF